MEDRLLHINSQIDRATTDLNTAQFTSYLARPIRIPKGTKATLRIESIEIPNTQKTFPPTANRLWYILRNTNEVLSVNLGSEILYTPSLIALVITQAWAFTHGSGTISMSWNATRARLEITNNSPTLIFEIVGSERYQTVPSQVYNNCAERLGAIYDLSIVSKRLNPGGLLVFDGIPRLIPTNCYYLECDLLKPDGKQSCVPSPYQSESNILARVPAGNFGTISSVFNISNLEYNIVEDTEIKYLRFSIKSDEFDSIDLNGASCTFSIRVTISK